MSRCLNKICLQPGSLSLIYGSIERRFGFYLQIMQNKTFITEKLNLFYPTELEHPNTQFGDIFDEKERDLEFISFAFFRIIMTSDDINMKFPNAHLLFVALETLLFAKKVERLKTTNWPITFLSQIGLSKGVYKNVVYNTIPFAVCLPLMRLEGVKLYDGLLYFKDDYIQFACNAAFYLNLQRDQEASMPKILEPLVKQIEAFLPKVTDVNPYNTNQVMGTFDEMVLENNLQVLPPCIYKIIRHMKIQDNIMFDARHQMGVFFYHTGLPLSCWIRFLYSHPAMVEKIKKESAIEYYFRYCYGTKGMKIIEPAWSCCQTMQVQSQMNHYHGCPFDLEKHSGWQLKVELRAYLNEWKKVKEFDVESLLDEIYTLAVNGQRQKICGRLCEWATGDHVKIIAPNQFTQTILEQHN
ncbi:hypothetical protein EIN_086020 [Entamoeba invadens IP1]|uniref:hypothetical protein n=1 Tax=Entamoeba invadens IP1 TaxID=370355 RepID=UPI0002C3EFCF|nr:hypothetical protein EIN_086020 [Entamoeba invadens IP1]ELP85350.1 hypothetical protein EIN_086020 [Entamoeba invadens IP1]|eukprot:XP_004184696.1 hypothetical protein EIN_086020 [Entamoeba invadens IP1]